MKKTYVFALASIAVVSVAASCARLEDNPTQEVPGEGKLITITASIPDDGITKVSFDQQADAGAIKLYWEAGDQITVTDASNPSNTQTFTLSSAPGSKTGTFSGTALTGSPSSFNITYDATGGVDYADQTQAADESTAHLRYAASLNGVDKYNDFTFSQSWATANGSGTFASSSVLRLRTKLPAALVGNVEAVIFKADAAIFNGASEIKVNLTNKADAGESGILTAYASLPAGDVDIPADTKLCVQYQVSSSDAYTAFRQFTAAKTLEAGKVNALNFDCSDTDQLVSGLGTSASPYLIGNAFQMDAMHYLVEAGKTIYFKQTANVNLNGVDWTPLNPASPYTKGINYDGQNFTISNLHCESSTYPSFFGVLNGHCSNVKFIDASVSASTSRCGIVAGYCGSADIEGHVYRVHVQGSVTNNGSKYGTGGFFGCLANGSATACSADVTVTSSLNNVGGIYGYCGNKAVVQDCWTSGVITGNQRVGGIGGGTDGKDAEEDQGIRIVNCYSRATVRSSRSAGGIAGFLCIASTTVGVPETAEPGNHVEKCIAWNDEITGNWNQKTGTGTITPDAVNQYSNAPIVGYTARKNYLSDCYRNPAMVYNTAIFFDYSDKFPLYDQDNASPTSPLTINTVEGATYNYPYNGKAAAVGKTVSEVAQDLGWSSSVWDFSKDFPTLK